MNDMMETGDGNEDGDEAERDGDSHDDDQPNLFQTMTELSPCLPSSAYPNSNPLASLPASVDLIEGARIQIK